MSEFGVRTFQAAAFVKVSEEDLALPTIPELCCADLAASIPNHPSAHD